MPGVGARAVRRPLRPYPLNRRLPPPIFTRTSPARTPANAAGPPGKTSCTRTFPPLTSSSMTPIHPAFDRDEPEEFPVRFCLRLLHCKNPGSGSPLAWLSVSLCQQVRSDHENRRRCEIDRFKRIAHLRNSAKRSSTLFCRQPFHFSWSSSLVHCRTGWPAFSTEQASPARWFLVLSGPGSATRFS